MGTTLHDLRPPEGARRPKRRVGRGVGSGRGKTSTRGMKGQLARRKKMRPGFEGGQNPIHRRVPKRGFVNILRVEAFGVNLSTLEAAFDSKSDVTEAVLRERGLVPKKAKIIKILAGGELTKPLTVRVHRASKSAIEKIQGAGGAFESTAPVRATAS